MADAPSTPAVARGSAAVAKQAGRADPDEDATDASTSVAEDDGSSSSSDSATGDAPPHGAAAAATEGDLDPKPARHGDPDPVRLAPDDPICILGEVVGGYRLPIHDPHGEYYAYVLVRCGDDNACLHATRAAREPGRNPVWTPRTGSVFFWETTCRALAAAPPLTFGVWVKRKDPLRLATLERRRVGRAAVDAAATLLPNLHERPLEVDLEPEEDGGGGDAAASGGKLTLRFRLATVDDQDFVEALRRRAAQGDAAPPSEHTRTLLRDPRPLAPLVTEANETRVARATFVNALSNAFSARNVYRDGEQRVRIKPHPDPVDPDGTAYLSPERLRAVTLEPSREWVEAGTGAVARLYLEILSCHDLPNVDVGEAMGNVTDCFVCAVFEDAMVQTPVIDDELSPHWLPWTQRAFVFGCMHPASILYLGAFDYELGLSNHEPVGRVAVNISNLQRDTEYVLTYQMYNTSHVAERKPSGTIRIRLRIEYQDEKKALLAALAPRPKFHINVFKEKSLQVVRYTCFGEYGDDNNGETFDLTVLRSYVNEILEYKNTLLYYIHDALLSVIFWRGQIDVLPGIRLPLHSFVIFCSCAYLVEHPQKAPSFFLLSIAWIMLAIHTVRRQHPSPWHRCPSFWHYAIVLHRGQSSLWIDSIAPNEGQAEAASYNQSWTHRLESDQRIAATKAQLIQEMRDFGNENIHTTQRGAIPLDLLQRLSSYQSMLGRCCKKLRFIKIIATWEESIISFWITAVFLAAGLVSFFFPWVFILQWTGRISVWCLLGPHMILVDLFLHSKDSSDDDILADLVDSYRKESRMVRLRHQAAAKLKDIKQTLFGSYSTLIPPYNLSRHYDRPLPESLARLHDPSSSQAIKIADAYVPGQQCFGDILPRPHRAATQHEQALPTLERFLELVQMQVKLQQQLLSQPHMALIRTEDEDLPADIGFETIHSPERNGKTTISRTNSPPVQALTTEVNILKDEAAAPMDATEVELLHSLENSIENGEDDAERSQRLNRQWDSFRSHHTHSGELEEQRPSDMRAYYAAQHRRKALLKVEEEPDLHCHEDIEVILRSESRDEEDQDETGLLYFRLPKRKVE